MQLGLPTNETRAMTSSGKDDWCTPQSLLRQLDDEFEFGVDASATAGHEAFPGRPHWGPGSSWGIVDALGPSSWRDRLVDLGKPLVAWLNPPYSKAAGTGGQGIRAWHHRAWEESRREALSSSCSARRISHAAGDRATPGARRPLRLFSHSSPTRLPIDPDTGRRVDGNTQDSCLVVYRPNVPVEGHEEGPWLRWVKPPPGSATADDDDRSPAQLSLLR